MRRKLSRPEANDWLPRHLLAGAGWEVQILEAGEILLARQCDSEAEARYAAEACRQDLARTGWTAIEKGGA